MNKHSFNLCLITGLFYLALTALIQFWQVEAAKTLFMFGMWLLPGITFPLASTNFYTAIFSATAERNIYHFVVSAAIYYGITWIATLGMRESSFSLICLAGMTGSLFYLFNTSKLLGITIKSNIYLLAVIGSGLSFLPYGLFMKEFYLLGVALCAWTLINWLAMQKVSLKMRAPLLSDS